MSSISFSRKMTFLVFLRQRRSRISSACMTESSLRLLKQRRKQLEGCSQPRPPKRSLLLARVHWQVVAVGPSTLDEEGKRQALPILTGRTFFTPSMLVTTSMAKMVETT